MFKKALLTLFAFSFLAAFNSYADEGEVVTNDENPTPTVEQPTPDEE